MKMSVGKIRLRLARLGPSARVLPVAIVVLGVATSSALAAEGTGANAPFPHALNPNQSLSSPASSPFQQQEQNAYRTDLMAQQRERLQANPSGLGRSEMAIGNQLNHYNSSLH
jgi:hypothetical protein